MAETKRPPVRPTWVEINLDHLKHNFNALKNLAGTSKMMGVVKADGYGHGAVEIARELAVLGVDYLAVATLDEAVQLREADITLPILILGYTPADHIDYCLDYGITPTVYTRDVARKCSDYGEKTHGKANIHIKVETGMGRIGVSPDQALDFIQAVGRYPGLEIEGVFTHFSSADEKDKSYTHYQLSTFNAILESLASHGIKIPLKHAANSPAAISMPESHLDMVRVGLCLYGLYPAPHMQSLIALKPVINVKSRVSFIKTVPEGTAISYGRKYVTDEERIIGTLPLGYADGFTRLFTNRAEVLIHGQRVPVIGAVCMDQTMFLGDKVPEAKMGDEVVIIGHQGNEAITVEELADKMGTINYEMVTMLDQRVPRLYWKDGELVREKGLNWIR